MAVKIFDLITSLWCAVSITALICYKVHLDGVKTYGQAIRLCTLGLLEMALNEVATRLEKYKDMNMYSTEHNVLLYLTNQEVLEIVTRIKEVFEFPKLRSHYIDKDGVLCIQMDAIAIISKYKDIDTYNLREIIRNIIELYYMEVRGFTPMVYIPIATGNNVLIQIPLSPYAEKVLKDGQTRLQEEVLGIDYLEEEVVLDEEMED